MAQGKVKWFNDAKGFGFIENNGKDYFVHFSSIQGTGRKTLFPNQIVEFERAKTERGDSAQKVVVLADS